MKQQTFEKYLQERFSATHGSGDETSDDFDQWIAELDPNKVIEYAERWGDQLKRIYCNEVLADIIKKNHDVR